MGNYSSVVVLDSSGQVVGTLGAEGSDGPLEGPGVERIPLPGGGFLVARPVASSDDAWTRYARAFIHETRSPLNALAIYLELLTTRLASPPPNSRPEASGERIVTRASDQIRRMEELLRHFGELWGARGESTQLSDMLSAIARFSEHEALRLGLTFSAEITPGLSVAVRPAVMSEALVQLLGAVFRGPPECHIRARLAPAGTQIAMSVEIGGKVAVEMARELLRPGTEALLHAGARLDMKERSITALFPRQKE